MIEQRRASAESSPPERTGDGGVRSLGPRAACCIRCCGTFEFGHFLIQYSTLNDAVRNASRFVAGGASAGTTGGLVTGGAWSSLVTQGTNLLIFGNIAGTGSRQVLPSLNDPLQTTITMTPDTVNRNIAVTTAYTYQPFFAGAIPTFMGGSISTAITLKISVHDEGFMKKMQGIVTVEFAIVGAALMMVIFGCLEFGRATYSLAALNEGTRRAARLAAVCPINDPVIKPAVNFMGINGFSASNVTVSYLDANGNSLGTTPASSTVYYVQVSVAGAIPLAIPFLSESVGPSFTVTLPAESLGVTIAADGSGVLTPC